MNCREIRGNGYIGSLGISIPGKGYGHNRGVRFRGDSRYQKSYYPHENYKSFSRGPNEKRMPEEERYHQLKNYDREHEFDFFLETKRQITDISWASTDTDSGCLLSNLREHSSE